MGSDPSTPHLRIDSSFASGVVYLPESETSVLPPVEEQPTEGGPAFEEFVDTTREDAVRAGGLVENLAVGIAAYGTSGIPIRITGISLVNGNCSNLANSRWVGLDIGGGGADDTHGMTVELQEDGSVADAPTGGKVITANGVENWHFPRQVGGTEELYAINVVAPDGQVCDFELAIDHVIEGESKRTLIKDVNGAPLRTSTGVSRMSVGEVKYPY